MTLSQHSLRAFLKATWWGGFAAGCLPLVFTIPFGFFMLLRIVQEGEAIGRVWLVPFLPLLISVPATGLCLAIVGIPVAKMLARQGGFSQGQNAAIGAGIGGIVMVAPAIYFHDAIALVLPLFGAIGGSVAAAIWYSAQAVMIEGER